MSATLKVPAWERAVYLAGLLITAPLWIPDLGLAWFVCRYVKRWEVE